MKLRADSPAEDEVQAAPGFDDFELKLGDVMRGERATLGKSLLDVQRELRIRASYIAAIENCDISAFDAPSFIAGYVRSYARYLGMDSDWTFRRFCEESGYQPVHGMAPAASGPKPQRRPTDVAEALANPRAIYLPQPESFWSQIEPRAIGSLAVLIALVGGLAYGGYAVLQEVQKVNLTPVDQAPGVVAALDPAQDVTLPAGGEGETELAVNLPRPEVSDRVYRPQALEVPVLTRRESPIAAIDPGLTQPEAPSQAADPAAAPGQQAVASGPQLPEGGAPGTVAGTTLAAGEVRTVAPDAAEVEILAARPAWVRVTSADGTVILEKTLDAGERFALPKLETPPVLRSGNSGAIYFAVNGQTFGPAAPGPNVVKNIELSPTALTTKYAAADLAKDPELASMVAIASVAPLAGDGTAAPDAVAD
ncbi:helix-turn-helix domain-containing protein [Paracoccus suum]|uniref:Helix-turn-helix domain-containing protein n=1 Tax=Paracoccus suum TaxID=2259340 RepID=A0A344PJE2_9RHOB|nr:helix-turn-helix domain-containing protein [Paracoccus suum]AXC49497.1 helix-turn-helix domain-containing protein [Paracoccus suum]